MARGHLKNEPRQAGNEHIFISCWISSPVGRIKIVRESVEPAQHTWPSIKLPQQKHSPAPEVNIQANNNSR